MRRAAESVRQKCAKVGGIRLWSEGNATLVLIHDRFCEDKMGQGMGMARCGLRSPTDERQHKSVKPYKQKMQGFAPLFTV